MLKNNFFIEEKAKNNKVPLERKGLIWKLIEIVLVLLFIISLLIILANNRIFFFWNYLHLLDLKFKSIYFLILSICFSIITTLLHEFMHIIFSNNFKKIKLVLNYSIKKSTAFVTLTHVWTWSLCSRILAVTSGIILDMIILSSLLLIENLFFNEIISLFSLITFLRIIWQMRVHKNTDGRYFVMMLLDNPLLDIDYKNNICLLSKKEIMVWKLCIIIGKLIDIYLVLFWFFPFFIKLCLRIGGILW